MPARIPWMTESDHIILGFLAGHELEGFSAPPSVIASNANVSTSHVKNRLRTLLEVGLVERPEETPKGYYRLTDLGRRTLDDNLSDEEYRQLVESRILDEDE